MAEGGTLRCRGCSSNIIVSDIDAFWNCDSCGGLLYHEDSEVQKGREERAIIADKEREKRREDWENSIWGRFEKWAVKWLNKWFS